MTLLYDDTQVLLAFDPRIDESSRDKALESVSGTVVTQLALEAKAISYRARVARGLAAAANQGATVDELAAAAGMSPDEVLARLRAARRGLLESATRVRLEIDHTTRAVPSGRAVDAAAAAVEPARSAPARSATKGWTWPSRRR